MSLAPSPTQLREFKTLIQKILQPQQILSDPAERLAYGVDNSRLQALPDLVLLPTTAEEIQQIVLAARNHRVPIVTRGRGTGTTGAAVPRHGGVVLSTEQLCHLGPVEKNNRMIRVQSGVTNQQVQQAAAKAGLFWPPDPGSAAFCSVGGNIGCNAGGPRAVKYGATRDNVLGLSIVTGTGVLIHTGSHTTKHAVGLDLTRLVIGSEGTLAIVVDALLKLLPLPSAKLCVRIFYRQIEAAAEAIGAIMSRPIMPSALEFMDHHALELLRRQGQTHIPQQARALLMIELDGSQQALQEDTGSLKKLIASTQPISAEYASEAAEIEDLWQTRKALSPALRHLAPKKINEDVVVPVAALPELINGLDQLSERHQIMVASFGHAGNGNIHVNLMLEEHQTKLVSVYLNELFELTLKLRGSLSGEHGIGELKKEYLSLALEPEAIALMKGIKKQFDPDGILNPGTGLPD
ncbi:MAG TPA: FAD-binding oxidoreductase [Gammaproteobacteria bacterium]|nr:FAD-binding oxidoreductase [Gammaproteobacteria bacterium]